MVDIVTRLGKGSPLTNAEVDANFTNLAEVSGVTGEPMGHEDRTTSTISFNASTRTFTIAPVASSFTVWCKGKKVVVSTAQTVTIPNTTGMYSIYYDANGVLSAKSGYFTFSLEAPTAYVYWNATTGAAPYFGDERHGVVLDWQTHEYLHRTRGAALASGFSASGYVLGGNGSSNSHAQITLDGGTFFDEDMKIIVTATNTPTAGTWEQDLLSPARIPVLYLSGTAWVIDSPTDYPLKQGTARPQYNAYSGGVWSTADVANNKYSTSWILATNNLTYPVIAIIGQAQNDSQSAAEAVDFTELQLPGFPSVEFRPLYKLIFQCADSCTNAVHASLVSITDIRSIAAAGTAASIVTDHGNLSGLSDDDHPQYIHVDTLRTVSAAVKASFLPSQTSNAGKFLQTDGTATSWQALTSGNVTTALGFTPYNATNPSGYITGISSSDVTTALGFTPYNATNPSGYVTAAGARGAISVTGAGSYDSATGVINIVGGLTSFNTRTGAITLSSADVTTALGFTPYNNTNPSGYITGITSTMVTTALGFTPYNSSNPNGYISSITSANVTTALGFTPYNATNPSGYITSSALSGYLTSASAASTYLTDAMRSRGSVAVANIDTATLDGFYTQNNAGDSDGLLVFNSGGSLGPFQLHAKYTGLLRFRNKTDSTTWTSWKTVIHDGNYSSYTMPLSGGATWGMSYFDFSQSSVSLRITSGPGTFYIGDDDIANLASGALVATPSSRVSSGTAHLSTYAYGVSQGDNRTHFGYNSGGTYVNYIRGAATYFDSGTLQVAGNQVLHAGNYSSYSPTLTGTGASGTWGISISGNSATTSQRSFSNDISTTGQGRFGGWYTGNAATGPATEIGLAGGEGYILSYNRNTSAYVPLNIAASGANMQFNGSTINVTSGSLQQGGNQVLHAGNYSSYALPLSGGTLTGQLTIATGGASQFQLNSPTNTQSLWIRAGYTANGTATPLSSPTNIQFQSSGNSGGTFSFCTGNDVTLSITGSSVNSSVALQQSGNQVLHAGNYSSYALPLSGGTVSGGVVIDGGASNQTNDATLYVTASNSNDWGIRIGKSSADYGYLAELASGAVYGLRVLFGGTERFRVGDSSQTISGNQILHAGNYSSYALPLGGGTVSGTVRINSQLQVGQNTNGTAIIDAFGGIARFGRDSTSYGLQIDGSHFASFVTGNGYVQIGPLNASYSHFQTDRPQFYFNKTVYVDGNIYQYGSSYLYLHSGNYTSYAPSLTGSGANGTWGISISGNAATASKTNGNGGYARVGYGMAPFYNWGGANAGSGAPSDGTYTTGIDVGSHPSDQAYGFQIASNMWNVGLWTRTYNSGFSGWVRILDSSNYNSYSPTLTGGNASGTWGINVTGNAGSATTAAKSSATTVPASTAFTKWLFATNSTSGTQDWNHVSNTRPGVGEVLLLGNHANGPGGGNYYHPLNFEYSSIEGSGNVTQLAIAYGSPGNELYMRGSYSGSWNGWNRFLNSNNYNSYSPTLTGGNASGTWGINISGRGYPRRSDGNDLNFYWSGQSGQPTWLWGGSDGANMYVYNPSNFSVARAQRANGNFYIDDNYGNGVVGVYSSYRYQGVFAMGDSYKLPADGTTTGSLYGMAWSHPNAGGAAGNLSDHGLLIINNGVFRCAISNSIVAASNITAYSDERLKTNWRDMPENFVARLAQVKVGIYDRTDEEDVTQVGVSAQSFQKLLPQAIMKAKDEMGTLSVSYGNAALASAVELAKDNVELRARIERLESLINKLIGD